MCNPTAYTSTTKVTPCSPNLLFLWRPSLNEWHHHGKLPGHKADSDLFLSLLLNQSPHLWTPYTENLLYFHDPVQASSIPSQNCFLQRLLPVPLLPIFSFFPFPKVIFPPPPFILFYYLFIYLFIFCLFRAAPAAYGGSQARNRIGAAAATYTTATATLDP